MKTIIYNHKKTGVKLIKGIDCNYHHIKEDDNSCAMPSEWIENTNDWELVTPERESYEILFDDKNFIFFRNTITGEEFHIGDNVELKAHTSYTDGKRKFKIKSFQIQDAIITNTSEFVYTWTEDGKCPHLNDLIKIK
jgi:hypothetical protein